MRGALLGSVFEVTLPGEYCGKWLRQAWNTCSEPAVRNQQSRTHTLTLDYSPILLAPARWNLFSSQVTKRTYLVSSLKNPERPASIYPAFGSRPPPSDTSQASPSLSEHSWDFPTAKTLLGLTSIFKTFLYDLFSPLALAWELIMLS